MIGESPQGAHQTPSRRRSIARHSPQETVAIMPHQDATARRAEAVLLTMSFMKRVLKFLCIATVGALTSLSPPQLAMAGPHGTGGGPAGGGGSFGGPPGAGGGGRSFGRFYGPHGTFGRFSGGGWGGRALGGLFGGFGGRGGWGRGGMRGVHSGLVPGRAGTRPVSLYSRGNGPVRRNAPAGRGGWAAYGGKAILAGTLGAYSGWGAYRGWGGFYRDDWWADYAWGAWPAAWDWGGWPGALIAYGDWFAWPGLWDWDLPPDLLVGAVLASRYELAPASPPYVYQVPAYEYPFYGYGYGHSFNGYAEAGYALTADAGPRIPLW